MLAEFLIRKNSTGEVRSYFDDAVWDDEIGDFYYSEGSGSCDSLRRQWFDLAGGEEPPELCDPGLSEFSIEIRDGDKILYSEFED